MKTLKGLIICLTLFINILGLATIYSATHFSSGKTIARSFSSQMSYSVLAIVMTFLIIFFFSGKIWKFLTPWLYLLTCLALLWALIGGQKINNANSWIQLGGLSIQPSEFLKLSLVLVLARLFRHQRNEQPFQEFCLLFFLGGIPLFLILKQPDLGTVLTLIPVILALAHVAGYGLPRLSLLTAFLSLFLLAVVMSPIWEIHLLPLHDYQVSRIVRLLHQDGFSPLAAIGRLSPVFLVVSALTLLTLIVLKISGWKKYIWIFLLLAHTTPLCLWSLKSGDEQKQHIESILAPYRNHQTLEEPQLLQAKYALANGSFRGQGFLHGEQTQYQRLPYSYSDLIFAAFAEEWGHLGACLLLLLYLGLSLTLILLARHLQSFSALCVYGVSFGLIFQVLIHLAYTVGLMPMTGITLPFFSAGGSSLLASWLGIALALSVSRKSQRAS
jgi:rod shape determining protein RodA